MHKSKDLKRTLVLSGFALASFCSFGTVHADTNATDDGPAPGSIVTKVPDSNQADIKTKEVLAGVTRGGFATDAAWDPLNPWPCTPGTGTGLVPPGEGGAMTIGGGGESGYEEGGWVEGAYGPVWSPGGYYSTGFHHGGHIGGGHYGTGGFHGGGHSGGHSGGHAGGGHGGGGHAGG